MSEKTNYWSHRHPHVQHFERLFASDHLPEHLREVSKVFETAALTMLSMCTDGIELLEGLRKLLEAKDCFVRQRVEDVSKPGL